MLGAGLGLDGAAAVSDETSAPADGTSTTTGERTVTDDERGAHAANKMLAMSSGRATTRASMRQGFFKRTGFETANGFRPGWSGAKSPSPLAWKTTQLRGAAVSMLTVTWFT